MKAVNFTMEFSVLVDDDTNDNEVVFDASAYIEDAARFSDKFDFVGVTYVD